MSKATAKAKITSVFKTNGSAGITGANSQSALTGMLDDVYADLAEKVATPTNGDLIKTDASGNPVDSGISATSVSSHLASTSNPHSVTKAQVGLSNVDNTSDLNKPISTAAQEAIYPLQADVESLIDNEQVEPNFSELPLLCGQPSILFGNGTPAEAVVPDNWRQFADGGYNWNGLPSALGQQYINYAVSTGGRYIAVKDGYGALKWLNM